MLICELAPAVLLLVQDGQWQPLQDADPSVSVIPFICLPFVRGVLLLRCLRTSKKVPAMPIPVAAACAAAASASVLKIVAFLFVCHVVKNARLFARHILKASRMASSKKARRAAAAKQ